VLAPVFSSTSTVILLWDKARKSILSGRESCSDILLVFDDFPNVFSLIVSDIHNLFFSHIFPVYVFRIDSDLYIDFLALCQSNITVEVDENTGASTSSASSFELQALSNSQIENALKNLLPDNDGFDDLQEIRKWKNSLSLENVVVYSNILAVINKWSW
jgi:hypothetical protein